MKECKFGAKWLETDGPNALLLDMEKAYPDDLIILISIKYINIYLGAHFWKAVISR